MKVGRLEISPRYCCIPLTTTKSFEYQLVINKYDTSPSEFSFGWTDKRDYAGLDFTISLYRRFWFNLNIHDCRHWDYTKDCWRSSDDFIEDC